MLPEEGVTNLTEREAMAEFFFLGLRMLEGVEPERFRREFGVSLEAAYPGALPELIGDGLLAWRRGRLKLTGKGLDLANRVFLKFV
jgi:oxygen-independent coproporphyrinogen-3 oxidase